MNKFAWLLVFTLLVACAPPKLEGVHVDSKGAPAFTLGPNGQGVITEGGTGSSTFAYEVKDNKVVVTWPKGTMEWPVMDDGSIAIAIEKERNVRKKS